MRRALALLALLALAAVLVGSVTSARAGSPQTTSSSKPLCAATNAGTGRCFALLSLDAGLVNGVPAGYGPADLQSAYNLRVTKLGIGQTVAITVAHDNPNLEADLQVYRAMYGLPACTTANGCFRKVDQRGGTSYPSANAGWGGEAALDVDMVSAICPNCHILVVEADSSNLQHLQAAVNTAAALGADAISNSWGNSEFNSQDTFDSAFNHPGIAITASAGDWGYGTYYPSTSPYVTAVGGTTLTHNGRGWSETAWAGSGGGCSKYEPKPAWQTDSGCANRTAADVAAVADPATGVAVYDSFKYSGWLKFGGTSIGSPIIASIYAMANDGANASKLYAPHASLNDITSGSNASKGCSPSYLCTAGPGYDGPTGNGTPNGIGAF